MISISTIRFPSLSPFVMRDMASRRGRVAPVQVEAVLALPEPCAADRSLPAVVLMHGLGGVIAERELAYASELARRGYVALVVDGFAARKAPENHTLRALRVTESMLLADCFGALRALARHPAVDPERIAVVGFSYGGMIAKLAAYRQICEVFGDEGLRFAAHVSFYGPCVVSFDEPRTTGAPVAMLLGELDANVPVPRAREAARELEEGGSPVMLRIYEGAWHQWDGADRERRKVGIGLGPCALKVDPEGRVRDARSGMEMRGPLTRALVLGMRVSPRGYHILRDEGVKARSDRDLFAFLDRTLRAERGAERWMGMA
ncbi:dienelactone hydrolase family protein [Arenibaculum sp.]|jgi:dienelactone hydrolase|uniref:dienelactone hydrolase family protein n=1 Tax=Arenibaculum sp. TaxID=2865862 RepID=UPI002E12FE70|nr:dienelactone hydrolase family protein [Arenibaculum sp.]